MGKEVEREREKEKNREKGRDREKEKTFKKALRSRLIVLATLYQQNQATDVQFHCGHNVTYTPGDLILTAAHGTLIAKHQIRTFNCTRTK